jgi:large subunit ribosomal protein L28
MARKCQVTGKRAMNSNTVSHSHNVTKRRHNLNLIERRIWVPERNTWVKVKLTTRALKTIKTRGAATVLSKAGLL